jgi:hypothetical protein
MLMQVYEERENLEQAQDGLQLPVASYRLGVEPDDMSRLRFISLLRTQEVSR